MNITDKEMRSGRIFPLFNRYFFPTLAGMLGTSLVTMTDGIFVGRSVGADGVAAVNLIWAPLMLLLGLGLMLGMGSSVLASVAIAQNDDERARKNVTQSFAAGVAITALIVGIMLANPLATVMVLGASTTLAETAMTYMMYLVPGFLFNIIAIIGLFVLRADGAPRTTMWATIAPGILNVLLDYLFMFPLGMGIKGAALATSISYVLGCSIVLYYLVRKARHLALLNIFRKKAREGFRRNVRRQCGIGLPALLGEAVMSITMLLGNLLTAKYIGDAGVAAYGLICYYLPYVFLVGNAIAQGAQPLISFNHGINNQGRVLKIQRMAIIYALTAGVLIGICFYLLNRPLTALFLPLDTTAAEIAVKAFPFYALCTIPYIFNIASIGYYQSIERPAPAILFSLLRCAVFLIPTFIVLPQIIGTTGIWLSITVSETLTAFVIITYYIVHKRKCLRLGPDVHAG